MYDFTFTHHPALFFMISGGMENLRSDKGIVNTIRSTIKGLLIPWLFYSISSIVVFIIHTNDYSQLPAHLIQVAMGTIRLRFFSYSLWYLTCIATMRIVFSIMLKLKSKLVIFILSMFVSGSVMIRFVEPTLPYNIDNMLSYLFFYVAGYISFPYVCKAMEASTRCGKYLLSVSIAASGIFTALLFFKKNLLTYIFSSSPVGLLAQYMLCPFIVVWFYCMVARQFEDFTVMRLIGRNTLHLSGNEYIIKTLFPALLGIFGLTPDLSNPLNVYIYTAVLLVFSVYFLIPVEKRILDKITNLLCRQA